LLAGTASAADISVVGLFSNKAVLVIDGGKPKTYSAGAKIGDGEGEQMVLTKRF
jgi:aspartyl protease family protein